MPPISPSCTNGTSSTRPYCLGSSVPLCASRIATRPGSNSIASWRSGSRTCPSPFTPVEGVVQAEEARILRQRVDRLPDIYRDAVVLHYLEGLSTAETALLLGTSRAASAPKGSVGTAGVRIARSC